MTGNEAAGRSTLSKPITAGIALSAAGAIFYNVLPLLIGTAQDSLQLSNQQAGLIGSVFFLGYNLITISAFFWLDKVSWKLVSILMLPLAAFGMFLLGQLSEYSTLLAVTALIGAAYALLYGIGTSILAETERPTRWFGIKIAVEALTGAILLIGLPLLILPTYGFSGMTIALAVVTLGFLAFSPWVPLGLGSVPKTENEIEVRESDSGKSIAIWFALVAVAVFFGGQTEAWSFVERIGSSSGHEAGAIGLVLAVALVFAVAGSLIEASYADRPGFTKMMLLVNSAFIAGALCLVQSESLALYSAGAWLVTLSFGMGIPLLVALASQLDPDGRHTILTVPAIGIGAMLGPWLAGFMADLGEAAAILFSALSLIILATILTIFAARGSQSVPAPNVSI